MTERININLGNVQKTLFLPLWGRAEETKKKKPMLVDRTAARIIGQVDYDFSQMTQNLDDLSQIAWIKRSLICDQVIRKFLESYPEGTIVNIGCGLDTTFDRIDNGKLKWYDLDLSDVIELRRKFIQESGRRKFIASSFLENEWLNGIEVKGNVFFIAAGVLYYFEENQVKDFILRLTDKFLYLTSFKVVEYPCRDEQHVPLDVDVFQPFLFQKRGGDKFPPPAFLDELSS